MAAPNNSGGGAGNWTGIAGALVSTGVNAVSRGGPKRQYKYNKKMAEYQNAVNRANAEWAYEQEMKLRQWQLDYDSPAAQMKRFKDAGLNPNLIYGQGTPGNMGSPNHYPNIPGVSVGSIDAGSLGALGSEFQQARLMASQADLTRVRTEKVSYDKELTQAQTAVTKANPYLAPGYVQSLVTQLKATADLKSQERNWMLSPSQEIVNGVANGEGPARGYVKMAEELRLLQTKFKLQEGDLKLKAEILQSKEFQNALQKIQVEWMRDAEITPQHIYQGIFMLLQSLMR